MSSSEYRKKLHKENNAFAWLVSILSDSHTIMTGDQEQELVQKVQGLLFKPLLPAELYARLCGRYNFETTGVYHTTPVAKMLNTVLGPIVNTAAEGGRNEATGYYATMLRAVTQFTTVHEREVRSHLKDMEENKECFMKEGV